MVVICEECGKKYRFDPSTMKTDEARFKCKACDHLITVVKPEEGSPPESPPAKEAPREEIKVTEQSVATAMAMKEKGLSLLTKMMILFLVVPSAFLILAGVLYHNQLSDLSALLVGDSKNVVKSLSEEIIAGKARSVAKQVKIFLADHPGLDGGQLNTNEGLKRLALIKVGTTGYTCLFERPLAKDGAWPMWVHPNPRLIGADMRYLKKKSPDTWKILFGVRDGEESRGYYLWEDQDGQKRAKFQVCTPIPGTNYVTSATTYIDEFTTPVRTMETRAGQITNRIRNFVFGILGVTLLVIGLIVSIYSHKLSGRIRGLTDHAERISVGELDADLKITAKDEIGDLGEAITRMQDSIRFSIERLRRRR